MVNLAADGTIPRRGRNVIKFDSAGIPLGTAPTWATLRSDGVWASATAVFAGGANPGFVMTSAAASGRRAQWSGPAVTLTEVRSARIDIDVICGLTAQAFTIGFETDDLAEGIRLTSPIGGTTTTINRVVGGSSTYSRDTGYLFGSTSTGRHTLSIDIDTTTREVVGFIGDQMFTSADLPSIPSVSVKPIIRNQGNAQTFKILKFDVTYELS